MIQLDKPIIATCDRHISEIRAELESHGVDHLISPDDRSAEELYARHREGKADPSEFDPLLACQLVMIENAIRKIGVTAVGRCAPCVVYESLEEAGYSSESEKIAREWIVNSSLAAAEECVRLGIVQRLERGEGDQR